jgi:hypothetical protein
MITLEDWFKLINYRITEGYDYYYPPLGNSLLSLHSSDPDFTKYTISVIINTKDSSVSSVEACDYMNRRAYRLISPDYRKAVSIHAKNDPHHNVAWDDVDYIDLELDEDWLKKADSIIKGVDYDNRIDLLLDLPDDTLMELFKLAHAEDITFNQLIENILKELLKETTNKEK